MCGALAVFTLRLGLGLLAALLGLNASTAQQGPSSNPGPQERITRSFTTADGSRFLLVVDDSLRQVHWATATWNDGSDDPPGLEGLTRATLLAARGGTWQHGSKDPAAEQAALQALENAWHEQLLHPKDQAAAARIVACEQAAARLGDPRQFARVLAAAPAHRAEVMLSEPAAVHLLTTIEDALPEVAALLVERREQQPLRGLYRAWSEAVQERAATSAERPAARLHAELLALMMPLSPASRLLDPRQESAAPRRAQALACWQSTQHPSRTVHVLFGAMNAERVEAILRKEFSSTQLPTPRVSANPAPRPLTSERRSLVAGIDMPRIAMGWALPEGTDHWTVELAVRWLARQLTLRLARSDHPRLSLVVRAPWPPTTNGASLLLIDLADPDGLDGMLDLVLEALAATTARDLSDNSAFADNMDLQRQWNSRADNPRLLAATLAEHALLWPSTPFAKSAPPRVPGADVSKLLRRTFAGRPAIVEGRR